jgi:hypothetical protein
LVKILTHEPRIKKVQAGMATRSAKAIPPRDPIVLLEQAKFSHVTKCLTSFGRAPNPVENITKARALFPGRQDHVGPITEDEHIQVNVAEVIETLKKQPRDRAGGPSHVTYDCLRRLAAFDATVPQTMVELANSMLANKTDGIEGVQNLRNARGCLLYKTAARDAVRPIAISETFTQLVSKMALAKITRAFHPHTYGHRTGVEPIVHIVRALHAYAPAELSCVLLDLRNCYNALHRGVNSWRL